MATPLNPAEIAAALAALPGWEHRDDALARTFDFGNFRAAFAFMVRVAFEAESLDHHPDWSNSYSRVEVRLTTHDAGRRVTARDVELAGRIQKLAPPRP